MDPELPGPQLISSMRWDVIEFALDSCCIAVRSTAPYLLDVKPMSGSSKMLSRKLGTWLTTWLERFLPKLGRKRLVLAGGATLSNSGFFLNWAAEVVFV